MALGDGIARTVQVVIGAALSPTFRSTFGQAAAASKNLGQSLNQSSSVNWPERIRFHEAAVASARTQIVAADAAVQRLTASTAAGVAPTREHAQALGNARFQADLARKNLDQQSASLDKARAAAERAAQGERGLGAAVQQSGAAYGVAARGIGSATEAQKAHASAIDLATQNLRMHAVALTAATGAMWAYGRAVGAGLKAFSDIQAGLIGFGIVTDSADSSLGSLHQRLVGLSALRVTNQSPTSLLNSITTLVGKGMEQGSALASIEAIGRTATATGASMEDMSNAAFALVSNMQIAPPDLGRAMDTMAQSAKDGGFELKNMARWFPELTARAQIFGVTGQQGVASLSSMLQVALQSAGSPDKAANNVINFLAAFRREETIKAFSEFGVDLNAEISDAMRKGINPFERVIAIVKRLTGGDPLKLGKLFRDEQAFGAVVALTQATDRYIETRNRAFNARGVVDRDYERRVETMRAKTEALGIAWNRVLVSWGKAVAPFWEPVLTGITAVLNATGAVLDTFPGLTGALTTAGGAAIGFGIALAGLRTALWASRLIGLTGAVSGLASVFGLAGAGATTAATGIGVAGAAAGGAAAGTGLLGAAMAALVSPIGLAVGAAVLLGGAAYAIYAYWTPITELFSGIGGVIEATGRVFGTWARTLADTWGPLVTQALRTVATAFLGFDPVPVFQTAWGGLQSAFEAAWAGLTTVASVAASGIGSAVSAMASQITENLRPVFAVLNSLGSALTSLREGWDALIVSIFGASQAAAPLPEVGRATASDRDGSGLVARRRAANGVDRPGTDFRGAQAIPEMAEEEIQERRQRMLREAEEAAARRRATAPAAPAAPVATPPQPRAVIRQGNIEEQVAAAQAAIAARLPGQPVPAAQAAPQGSPGTALPPIASPPATPTRGAAPVPAVAVPSAVAVPVEPAPPQPILSQTGRGADRAVLDRNSDRAPRMPMPAPTQVPDGRWRGDAPAPARTAPLQIVVPPQAPPTFAPVFAPEIGVTVNQRVTTPSAPPAVSGARAAGGPVSGGEAYLVGERGPEIIVPQSNGTVIPAQPTRALLKPAVVNVRTEGAAAAGLGDGASPRINVTAPVTVTMRGGEADAAARPTEGPGSLVAAASANALANATRGAAEAMDDLAVASWRMMDGGSGGGGSGGSGAGGSPVGAALRDAGGMATARMPGVGSAASLASFPSGQGAGLGAPRRGEDPATSARAKQAMEYFVGQGWSREQASGLVGNLIAESGLRTEAVGDGGKARGIAQWHPDRQAEFRRATGQEIGSASYEQQLWFVNHELTAGREQAAGQRLRAAQTPEQAAGVVEQYYERPAVTGQAHRRTAARRAFQASGDTPASPMAPRPSASAPPRAVGEPSAASASPALGRAWREAAGLPPPAAAASPVAMPALGALQGGTASQEAGGNVVAFPGGPGSAIAQVSGAVAGEGGPQPVATAAASGLGQTQEPPNANDNDTGGTGAARAAGESPMGGAPPISAGGVTPGPAAVAGLKETGPQGNTVSLNSPVTINITQGSGGNNEQLIEQMRAEIDKAQRRQLDQVRRGLYD